MEEYRTTDTQWTSAKLLIVDDEAPICLLLCEQIANDPELSGVVVFEADAIPAALEVLKKNQIQVVVLDKNLDANTNGIESISYLFREDLFMRISKMAIVVPGLLMLDILEWLPFGFYERKKGSVCLVDGTVLENVSVYVAKYPKEGLVPSAGYRDYVLKEAEAAGLPSEYIEGLRGVDVKEEFALDPGFCLSNPSKRRILESVLSGIYLKHDKLREKLTKVIP